MDARVELAAAGGRAGCNAWVIGDDEEVIVVDPGTDARAVFDAAGEREILAVICTHGHAAHVGAALEVAGRDESPVALHPRDRLFWREVHGDQLPEIEMEEGGAFEVADVTLEVLHTPGHSPVPARRRVPRFRGAAFRDRGGTAHAPGGDPRAAGARRGEHDRGGGEALRFVGHRGSREF